MPLWVCPPVYTASYPIFLASIFIGIMARCTVCGKTSNLTSSNTSHLGLVWYIDTLRKILMISSLIVLKGIAASMHLQTEYRITG
jgi:hypothetical protein